MRTLIPAALLVLLLASLAAAAPVDPAHTRLVRVRFGPTLTLESLLPMGFDIIDVKHGLYADIHETPEDAPRLAALGVPLEVVDSDVQGHAAARAAAELAGRPRPAPARVRSATGRDGSWSTQLLPPFGSGSMGGYWTLAEVKMKLDSLVANDPNDVVADKLDTLQWTWEGRPIWGLTLGKRMSGPETRPVVVYNSLIHAREPEGMQSLFYFVDDLLSKYGTDPWATYLLDQRVISICPVVNPDGYYRNESLSPGGGGMWRKNRRDNGDGTFGVDLNRNFGYKWGYDDNGSSPYPSSEVYRGPFGFSEPETMGQRDLVVALRPKSGLSFHTFGDYFLHPWGYTMAATSDSAAFYEWDDEATVANTYVAGNSPRLLYAVNGDFNDWAYGDTQLKPRAFTWTPEVGTANDGFWPVPSRIVPLALGNLHKCYTVAALAGPWARIEGYSLVEGTLNAGNLAHLTVRARNRGQLPTPALSATLVPLDAGTEVFPDGRVCTYPALASRTSADADGGGRFTIAAHDTVTPGRMVRFELDFTGAGGFFSRDTVEVLVGTPTVLLVDACNNFLNFTVSPAGTWGSVSWDTKHPDRYFADSPTGLYTSGMDARLITRQRFDLSASVHAWALFEARWMFEQDFDASRLEASLDSVTWTPMPGRSTALGVAGTQPVGQPCYQGARYAWKPEWVNLSSLAGPGRTAVRLRFRSTSDGGTDFDGFNLDSLRVLLFDPAAQPAPAAVGPPGTRTLALASPWPNPARTLAHLEFTLPAGGAVSFEILDLQGRRVRTLAHARYEAGRYALAWDLRDDAGRAVAPGVYLARLEGAAGALTRRVIVLD